MSLKLLITIVGILVLAVVTDAKPGHKGKKHCNYMDKECMGRLIKCRHMVMAPAEEDKCKAMQKMEEASKQCIKKNGLEEDYEMFEDEIGKYMPASAKTFMAHIMKQLPMKVKDITCCVGKQMGMVNESGKILVDEVKKYILGKVEGDEQLTKAGEMAISECPPTGECEIHEMKMCMVDSCMKYLKNA